MSYPSRAPRYQTQIPVIVTHSSEPQAGCIVDINAYGACVAGVYDVPVGHRVHLRGEIESNIGSVRWANGDRIGIYFERILPAARITTLRFKEPPLMPMAARLAAIDDRAMTASLGR